MPQSPKAADTNSGSRDCPDESPFHDEYGRIFLVDADMWREAFHSRYSYRRVSGFVLAMCIEGAWDSLNGAHGMYTVPAGQWASLCWTLPPFAWLIIGSVVLSCGVVGWCFRTELQRRSSLALCLAALAVVISLVRTLVYSYIKHVQGHCSMDGAMNTVLATTCLLVTVPMATSFCAMHFALSAVTATGFACCLLLAWGSLTPAVVLNVLSVWATVLGVSYLVTADLHGAFFQEVKLQQSLDQLMRLQKSELSKQRAVMENEAVQARMEHRLVIQHNECGAQVESAEVNLKMEQEKHQQEMRFAAYQGIGAAGVNHEVLNSGITKD